MSIEFELDSLITIFVTGGAVLSSFYFGIRLLGKENRTRANIFLGGLLILGALTILNNLFAHVGFGCSGIPQRHVEILAQEKSRDSRRVSDIKILHSQTREFRTSLYSRNG